MAHTEVEIDGLRLLEFRVESVEVVVDWRIWRLAAILQVKHFIERFFVIDVLEVEPGDQINDVLVGWQLGYRARYD